MLRYNSIFYSLFLALLIGCISYTKPNSKKVFKDGVNMLYGEITRDDLFSEYPVWYDNYVDYKPDSTVIRSLSIPHPGLKIEIFLGTWCSDSQREVPKFYKIVDESKFIENGQIKIWAVDRNKSLDSGLTDERGITNVATFILYMNEMEIGRLIEEPEHDNIETDLLSILGGS
jgi:hypothetical protein